MTSSVRKDAVGGLVASMNLNSRVVLALTALRSLPETDRKAVIDTALREMASVETPESGDAPGGPEAPLDCEAVEGERQTSTRAVRYSNEFDECPVGRTVRVDRGGS